MHGAGDDLAVTASHFAGGSDVATAERPVVLTLPHGRLAPLVGPHRGRLPDAVVDLHRLCSRPMVAVDLHLTRRVEGLPRRGDLILGGSEHHLTLLDLRPLWRTGLPGTGDHSVFQLIAADTRSLVKASDDDLLSAVLDDLFRSLPFLRPDDIERVELHRNADAPLFMNEAGADDARPPSTTAYGTNLYVAGDWCRTPIELACMEGALVSGTQAANAILAGLGVAPHELRLPDTGPSRRARVLRTVAAPTLRVLSVPLDAYRRRHPRPS